ncbi:MAG: hypothetical protein AAGI53_17760 [Planctomycetota bacterium]
MTNKTMVRVLSVVCLLAVGGVGDASTFGLDDIEFWVGEGANRVGVALDWDGDDLGLASSPSLAWGYRFDGAAVAEDALTAIVNADERLFTKVSTPGQFGVAVYGYGYDLNNDGAFAIDPPVAFTDGVAVDDEVTDGSIATDPGDAYVEGFFISGFWVFSSAPGPLAEGFVTAGVGVSSLGLSDEGWIALAFSPTFDFSTAPNNLVEAEPPLDALPSDVNADGFVNAADYTVLRDTGGDAAAFAAWRAAFGQTTAPTPSTSVVPEPTSFSLLTCVSIGGAMWRRRGFLCPNGPAV